MDLGFYPLGSCTMKYNPKVNEKVAALPGFTGTHPNAPEELVQGNLRLLKTGRATCSARSPGMDAFTLQPAAGAHGELTGMMLIRAALEARGNARKYVLIPDSAHGTNPSSAHICGYTVKEIKSNEKGTIDLEDLARFMNEDVAALMVTNPNTLGVFESDICRIAEIVHSKGGFLYMDGANMNALTGIVRPGGHGRRRPPPQPPQDLLDPARRRRPRLRPRRREEGAGALSPGPGHRGEGRPVHRGSGTGPVPSAG